MTAFAGGFNRSIAKRHQNSAGVGV